MSTAYILHEGAAGQVLGTITCVCEDHSAHLTLANIAKECSSLLKPKAHFAHDFVNHGKLSTAETHKKGGLPVERP